MDQGFIDILKTIIKEQSKDAVIDFAKCKSFLTDYTKGEFIKESRILLQALEAKVAKAVNTSQEIDICRKQQIRLLNEEYAMIEETAADIVDTLIHVLKGVPFLKREAASQENELKNKPKEEAKKEDSVPKEQYYITLNGTNSGPFELEAMKQKIKKGELKRETSVWKEGMKEWAAASAVKELSSFLPPSAPPPPATQVKIPSPPATEVKIPQPKPVVQTEQNSSNISINTKIGGIIPFGDYNWLVLDVQNNKALILAENGIEGRKYHEKDNDITWGECTLRKYLNGEFLQKFTNEQQKRIEETLIINNDNLWYGTKGGNDTKDKIFLLSIEEADKYFGDSGDYQNKRRIKLKDGKCIITSDGEFFSNIHDSERIAKYEKNINVQCWWWLRSPGIFGFYSAYVYIDGRIDVSGCRGIEYKNGVRPALWLKL